MLQILSPATSVLPAIDLGGSLTRQSEQEVTLDSINTHIVNIGKMVEDMEIRMRGTGKSNESDDPGDLLWKDERYSQ